ncbi:Hypothetical predicted protein, partial [Paramuricea clavata]
MVTCNSDNSVGDRRTFESDSACKYNHSYPEADECMYIIPSCGSTESSSVPESSSDEGDQITTSERPGRGLFSVGEVQTRRGRSVSETSRTFQRFPLAEHQAEH